jgi:glycosyltransferase involved in cell wall biosynthesis
VTSSHEGFCVPVVEAMRVGVPVVAYRQGALPEVLGEAGTFFESRDPYALASTIGAVMADAPGRIALAGRAATQLASLDLDTAADRFVALLSELVPASR